jgi:O-antigen biosynthesis protein WbqP
MVETNTIVGTRVDRRAAKRRVNVAWRGVGAPSATNYGALKRVGDAALAIFAIIVTAAPLILIWLSVRLTSSGPGLHWSDRVGRNGKLFRMPKFRTMREGTPLGPREGLANSDEQITALGRVLRRLSLDELPQLFCIAVGQMSFVGPRPLLPMDEGALARRNFPGACAIRPGLTGIAQISGRNALSGRRKARLDAFYARTISPLMDARIMARTVWVVITGRGFI